MVGILTSNEALYFVGLRLNRSKSSSAGRVASCNIDSSAAS